MSKTADYLKNQNATEVITGDDVSAYLERYSILFEPYILDIDDCLGVRAETAIAEATEISLRAAADKAEEALRDRQETANCPSTDGFGTTPHSILINQEEVVPITYTQNTLNMQEYLKPEIIEDAVHLLSDCDRIEMLEDLRKYADISPDAFKAAARRLEASKREQIRQWVLELNSVA